MTYKIEKKDYGYYVSEWTKGLDKVPREKVLPNLDGVHEKIDDVVYISHDAPFRAYVNYLMYMLKHDKPINGVEKYKVRLGNELINKLNMK